jgi:protein-disulfide isomerase
MSLKPPVGPNDHVQGNPRAPIELVEYGDYECPFCGQAYSAVKAVQEALGDDLKFVFRNFPLSQVHPHALPAAQAAEAAALQGRFWEMHDVLFEHQDMLAEPYFFRYAEALGLDMERFARDYASPEIAAKIRADFLSGARSGVNGTPTFFVNGEAYHGSWAQQDLVDALSSLLAGGAVVPS